MGFLIICSDRINDFYQKFISTLVYYVFRRKLLSTTPQKGEGEKKFCVRILCKKQHLANTRTHFRQLITTRDPMREGEGLVAIL